ncbi:MAG: CBS domain-containing protein [Vicingaceae bacterium]
MVKSYQGVRKVEEKVIQQLLVKDFMTTQLIKFHPNQSIDEVVNILVYRNISGGPVVDENNKLIGIISEGDCLKEMISGNYSNEPSLSGLVKDRMVKTVETLSPNHLILDAAIAFLDKKLRRFPVLENGELVGQISQRDVMRALENG